MSRIGKQPISIPSGIDVSIENSVLKFKKGNQVTELELKNHVNVAIENKKISFSPIDESRQSNAYWGTYRSLAHNVIIGLTDGFSKQLEVNGVGYRAAVKGKILELILGFSHPINFAIPEDIEITVDKNVITVKGSNKQQVGQVAAKIREFRPPEPYKGKGVKYVDEHINRKAGKTAKKG